MKYIIKIEVKDGLLLHNVITGQLLYLTEAEKSILYELPLKPEEKIGQLISWYYLVPEDFDEYKFVNGYRKVLQQLEKNKEKPITKFTIFPTTCCNAHCFYCFESEYKKINMDAVTAGKVVDYIEQNSRNNKIRISWFGGEPTVAIPCIDSICNGLETRGIDFVSGMVSNGYLFTEQIVKKAVNNWKLKKIQITLDGTEEVYNKTKNYNVAGSAYKRVLNNISLLLESGIQVSVLLNLDYYNSDDLYKLIDELAKRFRKYDNFRVVSHVLFNDEGYVKVHHTEREEEELVRRNYDLIDYLEKLGLQGNGIGSARKRRNLPKLQYTHCMTNDAGAIVIAPNGNLHRCEHIPNKLTSPISIDSGTANKLEMDEWFLPAEEAICHDCSLYPSCFVPSKCKDHQRCHYLDRQKRTKMCEELAKELYQEFCV